MKKEVDQQTHERIRRLMDSIKRQTHFAVTYEVDDKIEELENKLFNLCLGYDEARIYLKVYNKHLKELFRINENIYPHAKTEGGYRLRIQTRKAYKSST